MMTAPDLPRIGGGALAGAVLGVLLHFVFGLSLFSAAPRRAPAQEAPVKASSGILEKERLAEAHQKRVDDLAAKIAAAEQECADLKTRIAATPVPSPETARDAKLRRFSEIVVKMAKIGALQTKGGQTSVQIKPETAAEMQKMMGEILSLAGELGIDLQDPTSMFRNPELLSGVYEGFLRECGMSGDEAAVREFKTWVAGFAAANPQPPSRLAGVRRSMQIQEEFLERFGRKLMEKDPVLASLLGNLGSSRSVQVSEETTAAAATRFLKDVAKAAKLDDAQSSAVRPAFETWASQYAALLIDARTRYGDKVVDALRDNQPVGKTPDEQFAHLRARVRLMSQMTQLQQQTIETVAQQLGGDAAEQVLKFDKGYYFGRLKP
jgi:hypothetical protein